MTLNFNKVTTLIDELSHQAFGWSFMRQSKSHEVLSVNRHYQGNSAGGMFGLLVSSDATHRANSNGEISMR
jgi:PDZ domain-containing secreted protein